MPVANFTQLRILCQGADKWLQWSEKNLPDDEGADLSGADLSGRDLFGAFLIEADLRKANLRGCHFHLASFAAANLTGANLSGADLTQARFDHAVLRRANLSKCELVGTVFQETDLYGANFKKALLEGAIFSNTDLTQVKGLDSCEHLGPTAIDVRTIAKSWPLPISFLRGCGLDDAFINYLPSLLSKPIQFYSCFISYSTADQRFADRLYADLQAKGIRCWFAPHDIRGGKKLHEQIGEAIRLYDRLLLILSDSSMSSEWVKTEIAQARRKELAQKRQVLFPIGLVSFTKIHDWTCFDADTGKDTAREIREYFIPDFSNWQAHSSYLQAFQRLVNGLDATEKR